MTVNNFKFKGTVIRDFRALDSPCFYSRLVE
jgi:hypothetical protein